jgi:hypothetical protein
MKSAITLSACTLLLIGCGSTDKPSSAHWQELHAPEETVVIPEKGTQQVPPRGSSSDSLPLPQVPSSIALMKSLPATHLLEVPFTSQAPLLNWDTVHEETCEEASLLMAHRFLQGERKAIEPESAEADLLALVRWEERNNFGVDITIGELALIAEQYYGYKPVIEETVTVERIKEILAAGNPIIIPAAGRDLGNPYFSGEGPWYHMLIIRGYDRNEFIVNDPGTRRGEAYEYPYDTLISAIHDWTGVKENIRSGKKRMLILKK